MPPSSLLMYPTAASAPAVASGKAGTPPSWLTYPITIGANESFALPAWPPVYLRAQSFDTVAAGVGAAVAAWAGAFAVAVVLDPLEQAVATTATTASAEAITRDERRCMRNPLIDTAVAD